MNDFSTAMIIIAVLTFLLIPGILFLMRPWIKKKRERDPLLAPSDTPLEVEIAEKKQEEKEGKPVFSLVFHDPNDFDFSVEVPQDLFERVSPGQKGTLVLHENQFVSFQ